jgi:hypothetical protein
VKADKPPRTDTLDAVWRLPAGVRASYDRKMQACEAGWQATSDPWAVAEAMTLTTLHRQPPPAWLDDAVWALACKRRTKKHARRAREAGIRFMRYLAVHHAHHLDGLSWVKAYEHAAEVYMGNPDIAADAERMRKAYKQVKKDLRKGRGGLYFTPKKQQRHALKPNTSKGGAMN